MRLRHPVCLAIMFALLAAASAGTGLAADGASDPPESPATVTAPEPSSAAAPSAYAAAARARNMFTLDLTLAGGMAGYARRIGEHRYIGIDGGVDIAFLSYMIYAGRHFAESGGWSYEEKDGFTGKSLLEVLALNVYVRHVFGAWNIDTGVRGSAFLHFDSSDDDPGAGVFGGGYVGVFYGWRHVKFGPRVQAGVFTEDDPEFGVFLSPLIVRIAFHW